MWGYVTMTDEAPPVLANIPRYLYLHCNRCLRYVQITDLKGEIAKKGPLEGRKTVFGKCRRCGKEVRESIHTRQELIELAQRSVRYFERAKKKRNKREKITLAKKDNDKKTKKTKKEKRVEAKAAEKAAAKDEKKKSKKTKSSKTSKSSSKKTTTVRESHWQKKAIDGMNGVKSLMLIMAGGFYTIEELRKRHTKMVKAGLIWKRKPELVTTDFTWGQLDEVEIDGKKHVRLVGINSDEEFVMGVPSIADPLKKGSRPVKVANKGKKLMVGKMRVAGKRKDLKA